MISIKKSETADTRTCDWSKVTKETLKESSNRHIMDVYHGLAFFMAKLKQAGRIHDEDKISGLDHFHSDFQTGFKNTGWLTNHYKITRHHINQPEAVPEDVNLIDVIEHITDCVMAGMARSGDIYDINLPPALLSKAVANTVEMLKAEVEVYGPPAEEPDPAPKPKKQAAKKKVAKKK